MSCMAMFCPASPGWGAGELGGTQCCDIPRHPYRSSSRWTGSLRDVFTHDTPLDEDGATPTAGVAEPPSHKPLGGPGWAESSPWLGLSCLGPRGRKVTSSSSWLREEPQAKHLAHTLGA